MKGKYCEYCGMVVKRGNSKSNPWTHENGDPRCELYAAPSQRPDPRLIQIERGLTRSRTREENKGKSLSVVIAGGHAVAVFAGSSEATKFAFKHAGEWNGKSVKTCVGVPFEPKEVTQ